MFYIGINLFLAMLSTSSVPFFSIFFYTLKSSKHTTPGLLHCLFILFLKRHCSSLVTSRLFLFLIFKESFVDLIFHFWSVVYGVEVVFLLQRDQMVEFLGSCWLIYIGMRGAMMGNSPANVEARHRLSSSMWVLAFCFSRDLSHHARLASSVSSSSS